MAEKETLGFNQQAVNAVTQSFIQMCMKNGVIPKCDLCLQQADWDVGPLLRLPISGDIRGDGIQTINGGQQYVILCLLSCKRCGNTRLLNPKLSGLLTQKEESTEEFVDGLDKDLKTFQAFQKWQKEQGEQKGG